MEAEKSQRRRIRSRRGREEVREHASAKAKDRAARAISSP
jgi:hypothetical protein